MSQIELKPNIEGIVYRDLVPSDYDRWYEIYKIYDPEGTTPDHQRKRRSEWDWENDPRLELAAELPDGETVGFGRIMHRQHQKEGAFYLMIDVDPAFQGRGIGGEILKRLEAFALPLGANILTGFTREDNAQSKAWMEKRGYPCERNLFESELDFTTFDMSPFESMRVEHRSDVQIKTWRELGDTPENRKKVYEVVAKSDNGPDMEIWGIPSQEQYERDAFGCPWFTPDCFLIAICGGEWVGNHLSGPIEKGSDHWTTDYTGVVPKYRGRGIGMALKLKSIEIAMASGAKKTITHNDSENKWMLDINVKLGFVRQPGWMQMRKRL